MLNFTFLASLLFLSSLTEGQYYDYKSIETDDTADDILDDLKSQSLAGLDYFGSSEEVIRTFADIPEDSSEEVIRTFDDIPEDLLAFQDVEEQDASYEDLVVEQLNLEDGIEESNENEVDADDYEDLEMDLGVLVDNTIETADSDEYMDSEEFHHFLAQVDAKDDFSMLISEGEETVDLTLDYHQLPADLQEEYDEYLALLADAELLVDDVNMFLTQNYTADKFREEYPDRILKQVEIKEEIEYSDFFAVNDDGVQKEHSQDFVYFENIANKVKAMEITFSLGIFVGSLIILICIWMGITHIWRHINRTSETEQAENLRIEKYQGVKTVKLAGIFKSYAKIPVDIRSWKNPTLVYEDLYETA